MVDDDMSPELRNGAIAIADPDLPRRPNTTCIFRKSSVDEGGEVLVRRVLEVLEDNFRVYSYKDFSAALKQFEEAPKPSKQNLKLPTLETISQKSYPHCHTIVGALSPPIT
jgi:hypothetical protein